MTQRSTATKRGARPSDTRGKSVSRSVRDDAMRKQARGATASGSRRVTGNKSGAQVDLHEGKRRSADGRARFDMATTRGGRSRGPERAQRTTEQRKRRTIGRTSERAERNPKGAEAKDLEPDQMFKYGRTRSPAAKRNGPKLTAGSPVIHEDRTLEKKRAARKGSVKTSARKTTDKKAAPSKAKNRAKKAISKDAAAKKPPRAPSPPVPFPEWAPRPGEEVGLSSGVAGRPKSRRQTRDWDTDEDRPGSGGKKHGPQVSDMAKVMHNQMRRASDKGRRASAPRAAE